MSEPIRVEFKYTEEEYVSAVREYFARVLHLRLDLMAGVAGLGGGLLGGALMGDSIVWIVLIVASAVLLLGVAAAHFLIPRLRFRRDPKLRDHYTLVFSEQAISFRTAHIESQIAWKLYTHGWDTPDFYVLFYGTHSFSVIPKRAFSSAAQEDAFRLLLKSRNLLP
ncbi:MAG: YcxB family protein [Thermodesulfobacteriota bacterium]